ncbi:MAG TPA: hypothetical protein VFQ90_20955, partial [Stellaceae bacterium]|nr:hypothetical protein [Stellaceae bacterium]
MADVSLSDGRVEATESAFGRAFRRLSAAFAAEHERHILWLPVFFGIGIALYFTLTVEPPVWLGTGTTVVGVAAALLLRRAPGWRAMAWCLTLAAAGFS